MQKNLPSPDDLRQMMRDAFDSIGRATNAIARDLGIHPTDFAAIDFLNRVGGATTPTSLAQHLALTSGATTALIDRLEKVQYVKRRPNPEDRRGVLIELDPVHHEKIIAAYTRMRASFTTLLSDYSAEELETVSRFLRQTASIVHETD